MNLWIVVYQHRHGIDTWPLFQGPRPSARRLKGSLDAWEPGESIDTMGPFELPDPDPDAYSEGWDSHEGQLLKILGIQDLECRGIDQVVADLVRHCVGFKEWRKRFKQGSLEQRAARRRRTR